MDQHEIFQTDFAMDTQC